MRFKVRDKVMIVKPFKGEACGQKCGIEHKMRVGTYGVVKDRYFEDADRISYRVSLGKGQKPKGDRYFECWWPSSSLVPFKQVVRVLCDDLDLLYAKPFVKHDMAAGAK